MRGLGISTLLVSSLVYSTARFELPTATLEQRKIGYDIYSARVGMSLKELGIDEDKYEFLTDAARENIKRTILGYPDDDDIIAAAKRIKDKTDRQSLMDFIHNVMKVDDWLYNLVEETPVLVPS